MRASTRRRVDVYSMNPFFFLGGQGQGLVALGKIVKKVVLLVRPDARGLLFPRSGLYPVLSKATRILKHFSTIRCFFDAFRTKENREKKIFISCGEPRLGLGRVLSTGLWSAALNSDDFGAFLPVDHHELVAGCMARQTPR